MQGRKLLLMAGRAVDGAGLGRHLLQRRGRGHSFREHRPYQAGDDLRHVDWHVLARRDTLMVKVFEDEAPIRVELVIDASGSMAFDDKFQQQSVLAVAIAQVALAAGEEVGLYFLGDSTDRPLHRAVPPASGHGHVTGLATCLSQATCRGKTPMAAALTALSHQLRRRSHVIVISDFWLDPSALAGPLHKLLGKRHDVTLVHMWHPQEQELPHVGPALWRGMEEDGQVLGDSETLRPAFAHSVRAHQKALARLRSSSNLVFVPGASNSSTSELLRHVLMAHGRKNRRAGC